MDREVNIVNEWHHDGERPSSRTLAHCPIYKFLVQPVPTVVTPPNLSAHKPAGDRASRYKDPPQMPSRCCRACRQSQGGQGLGSDVAADNHDPRLATLSMTYVL